MKKIVYLLPLLVFLIFAKPHAAQAWCCKAIKYGPVFPTTVEVSEVSTEAECLATCKTWLEKFIGIGPANFCQNFYAKDATADLANNACVAPTTNCCEISYLPVGARSKVFKAYSVINVDECLYYCKANVKCTSDFRANVTPDYATGKCNIPPSSGSGGPASGSGVAGVNPKLISVTNPLNSNSIPGLIGNVISWLLKIIGALALALFFYAGFQWLTSAGSAKKIDSAKDTLLWASIGLICVFLSYIAVGFVLETLGVI